jgi:hypothetical protein
MTIWLEISAYGETVANSQAKRSLYTFRLDENDGWEPSILFSWVVNISLVSTLL